MSYDGYLCFGGVDVINDCRTLQLISDGYGPEGIQCRNCDPCCPDIAKALNGGAYNPVDSPWWNGTEDSANFAGLLVQSITGLAPGEYSRSQEQLASGGTSFGRVNQAGPVVVVRALVMSRTCCANEFGIRWIRNTLRNVCASEGCSGSDLTFLFCEPQTPDFDCPENDEDTFDFEAWIAPYYRTLKNVVLLSGPTVVETIPRGCPSCYDCGIPVVEFTLGAGRPCTYLDPVDFGTKGFDCTAQEDDECIEWVTGAGCDNIECSNTTDCGTDPDCVQSADPPSVPAITNPCVEDCISTDSCTATFQFPDGTFPEDGSGTLDISIFAGTMPLRRVKVQVFFNPLLLPVEELSDCDACSELNISYVAEDATLSVNGSTNTATITCAGGDAVRANPFIGGDQAAATFGYPDMQACGNYTVVVSANSPVSPSATVRIDAIGVEC